MLEIGRQSLTATQNLPWISALPNENSESRNSLSQVLVHNELFKYFRLFKLKKTTADFYSSATFSINVNNVVQNVEDTKNDDKLKKAEERLVFLSKLDTSRDFDESRNPSTATVREAGILIRKFVSLGDKYLMPTIGLDSEGFIIFSFTSKLKKIFGSLTVHGDATYSYSIEKGDVTVEDSRAFISHSISEKLIQVIKVE